MEILFKLGLALTIIGIIGVVFVNIISVQYDHSMQKLEDMLRGFTRDFSKIFLFFFFMLIIGIVLILTAKL